MPGPRFVPAKPPGELRDQLSAKQAAPFAFDDEFNHRAYRVVPCGDALIGYVRVPVRDDHETKIVIDDGKRVRSIVTDESHDFQRLVPSPSGKRFLIFNRKTGDYPTLKGGHVIEVDLATLAMQVVITGTTGRTGSFLANEDHLPEVSSVDYLGDDDTVVAAFGARSQRLVLLRRDPRSGRFEEVSRLTVGTSEDLLVTTGDLVLTNSAKKIGLYRRDGDRLVKWTALDKPRDAGVLVAHPPDHRREIYLEGEAKAYLLDLTVNRVPATVARAAAKPSSAKPRPKPTPARKRTAKTRR
jgi:hypothetical protein